ncbi:hypothetical protein T459_01878 [Capsicum annuum]|uniref:Peptidase M28 domain-containing protein n=1 Tax=Capsicum annuum TaxID=4072 RepID=A0A2G3AIC0_CAPAN|nr:hypothetical protein T459_01878 [Capsicum annuum]
MLKDDSLFLLQYAIRLSLLMDFPSLYALTAEYIEQKKLLGGLLLLLPPKFSPGNIDSTFGADKDIASLRNKLLELEWLLMHSNIPYPVYFAFEDDNISAVLAEVKRNDANGQPATATTGGYKLVVAASDPKRIASPNIANIQGWLPGLKVDGDSNQLPTIAIVASYDTFGAAPALSVGSDSNGSGVVALLEIARLFSALYSNPKTRSRYNLLFGLTSGGPYNYNGTQKWLRSFDQRVRESIDYAICLNSVGSHGNQLHLHVSKPPENAYIQQIFQGFSTVAEELGLQVGLKHKKINISNPRPFLSLDTTTTTTTNPVYSHLVGSGGPESDSRLGMGQRVSFWNDKCVGNDLLSRLYPDLYSLSLFQTQRATTQHATVAEMRTGQAWNLQFRRLSND